MQFPITRDRLQNYGNEEAMNVAVALKVEQTVKKICHGVEVVATNNREKFYTYRLVDETNLIPNIGGGIMARRYPPRPILNEVVVKLHELFPDCTIQVDPLKTYILIDWS